jgi:acetyltransferase-like isoleucine patch superfamily enzyme
MIRLIYRYLFLLKRVFVIIKSQIFYKYIFNELGKRSWIDHPLLIIKPENIYIGSNTVIFYKAFLAATPLTGLAEAKLIIGNNCKIGHFNQIFATGHIEIESFVNTADKVYISDNSHDYEDILKPIKYQKINQKGRIIIGQGSSIGQNVCIMGASIGKNCIIGANSVVTKDIPDYCVAVGSPAKVIRRFNLEKGIWEKL